MNVNGLILLGILFSSLITGFAIFFIREGNHRSRTWLNLLGAGIKLVLVAALLWGVQQGQTFSVRYTLLPGLEFALGADATSVLFVTLSTVLWFLTTVYAVGYLEESPHRSRFFGFFSLCVTATVGPSNGWAKVCASHARHCRDSSRTSGASRGMPRTVAPVVRR